MQRIIKLFDRIEDKIRSYLSRHPVAYALIGGVAIVLFWRGVWHTADEFYFLTGPVSIIISVIVLLGVGLFVSFFIGDQIILSGLKKEKKLAEKTEEEIESDTDMLKKILYKVTELEKDIKNMKR